MKMMLDSGLKHSFQWYHRSREPPVDQILTKFADIPAFLAYDLWQIQGGPVNPRGM